VAFFRGSTSVRDGQRMPAHVIAAVVFVLASAPVRPIVVRSGRGFDWTASGLGAAVGFGLALALVGSIALLRGRPTNARPPRGEKR
jgi:hypothetical protein